MSLDLASLTFANACAAPAQLRGQMVVADGYYFGYWFSH